MRQGFRGLESVCQLAAPPGDKYYWGLRFQSFFRTTSAHLQFADDPFRLIRFVVGVLLLAGTAIALLLAATGIAPRAVLLVGTFWALYGLLTGFLGGVLEPVIDGSARLFSSVGLRRAGGGFSSEETMVAQGRYTDAAEAYQRRSRVPGDRVEATLRRAALLTGPLALPLVAATELTELRNAGTPLTPDDDVRVGLALVDVYDFRLQDPGRAMAELRRLIDLHPESRHTRRMRGVLQDLKVAHFGSDSETPPQQV